MIVFKYTKTDSAEYLSHLDMLRHLIKIIRRAEIGTTYSKGFNPHMQIFMSAPGAVGIKSLCEYCLVDTDEKADSFFAKFNEFSFRGVKCLFAVEVNKKVSVAGDINRAEYQISGINHFDVNEVLDSTEFFVSDKKGIRKDVRQKIFSIEFIGDIFRCVTGFGNDTLRPDLLCNELIAKYGGTATSITKTVMYKNDVAYDKYLSELKI